MSREGIDYLYEWAVWAHLSSKLDVELVLLKGHLLLEISMGTVLKRREIENFHKLSFNGKLIILEEMDSSNSEHRSKITDYLRTLNRMRNKLAHEFHFDPKSGELEDWASSILNSLEGTKYTKYTYRTKIVQAFSVLSFNVLSL